MSTLPEEAPFPARSRRMDEPPEDPAEEREETELHRALKDLHRHRMALRTLVARLDPYKLDARQHRAWVFGRDVLRGVR